jgi:hypothetical protein
MTIPTILSAFDYMSPSPATADVQEFTLSGTWNKPAGAKMVLVELWGAGGGGGGGDTATNSQAGGGGGGAYSSRMVPAQELAVQVPVYIGAGGTGSINATGTGGNATVFGDISFNGTYDTSTQNAAFRNAILMAGGGSGGVSTASGGAGGYGGGTMSSATGYAGGSSGSGLPGLPASGGTGSYSNGGFGTSHTNNGTLRYSYMGGGTGDYGGNSLSTSGGGGSIMGGSGGGMGGGYNGGANWVTASDGGSATGGLREGSGGMGMTAFATPGKNGGPREGGGGGASGLPATMNHTVTNIFIRNNTAFCSGGTDGQSYVSTNPTNATPTLGTGHNGITSISYDGTQYIGVSRRGGSSKLSGIFTSPDGITWTLFSAYQTVIANGLKQISYIQELIFFNGVYVGIFRQPIGFEQGIAYSYDLQTWTLAVNAQYAYTLREANGVLYVGALSSLRRSTDGITWTNPSGVSGTLLNVAASPAGVVVVQTITTTTFRSTDNGLTFTASSTTSAAASYQSGIGALGGVVWNATDAQFLLVGGSSVFTSPDGNTWTSRTSGTTDVLSGLATGLVNSINYYMTGSSTSNTNGWLYSSDAGVTWAMRNLAAFTTLPAGAGGRGGFPSGGGGGGGTKGTAGGAGGAGGAGFARITSW